jgi:hypothetical protein
VEAGGIEPPQDFNRGLALQIPVTDLTVSATDRAMWHLVDLFPFIEPNRMERSEKKHEALVRHFFYEERDVRLFKRVYDLYEATYRRLATNY